MRKTKGLVPLLVIVVIAIIVLIVFVAVNASKRFKESPPPFGRSEGHGGFGRDLFSSLPECTNQKYSVPIVDVDEIESITPLGNLNPPEHTTPTNHMYLDLKSNGVTLKSPADITLTSISSSYNAERDSTDYSIDFSLCKDLHGYFIHIKSLVPELEGLIGNKNCEVYGDGGKYKNCWSRVEKKINAGDIIGTVGNSQQTNFDFGTYDLRKTNNFANPKRYGNKTPHIVCPFDYYSGELKSQLTDKLDRTIEPVCGQVNYDVVGTLQGNWFFGDAREDKPDDWSKNLVFAYSNFDPSVAVISIGGVFTQASTYSFFPKNEGFINRAFDQVKPNGNIYCYESEEAAYSEKKSTSGKILVKLTNDTELQIEKQSGECSVPHSFINPTIYNR